MIPVPIPNDTIRKAQAVGWKLKVISGPDGDLTGDIRPVEALVGIVITGAVDESDGSETARLQLNVLIQIEDDDLEILARGDNRFWITFSGHIVPFSLSCFDPEN